MQATFRFRSMLVAAALAAALSACNRDRLVPTECLGDVPAVPRIHDVAPPNCPDD